MTWQQTRKTIMLTLLCVYDIYFCTVSYSQEKIAFLIVCHQKSTPLNFTVNIDRKRATVLPLARHVLYKKERFWNFVVFFMKVF